MIIHVNEQTVSRAWPHMIAGLSRALEKTELAKFWDLDSAYELISKGELFGFHIPNLGYSGIYSINTTPKAKVLYFFWSGRNPDEEEPLDLTKLDQYFDIIGREFGCQYINGEGRLGWKSFATTFGYRPDGQLFIREVRE